MPMMIEHTLNSDKHAESIAIDHALMFVIVKELLQVIQRSSKPNPKAQLLDGV